MTEQVTHLETMVPWRRSELRRAGCDARLAAALADDLRYDVPAMLALIDRGCAPEVAARILAPLEEER
jgi:hypothetical protein